MISKERSVESKEQRVKNRYMQLQLFSTLYSLFSKITIPTCNSGSASL